MRQHIIGSALAPGWPVPTRENSMGNALTEYAHEDRRALVWRHTHTPAQLQAFIILPCAMYS
jgi:hypothetical protein